MEKKFISVAELKKRILKEQRALKKQNKSWKKDFKVTGADREDLFNHAVKIGVVDSKQFKLRAAKGKGKKYKKTTQRKTTNNRGKYSVTIGIMDRVKTNKPNRVTTDSTKWLKNQKYWDLKGMDTGMTDNEIKDLAKYYGIKITGKSIKQLINAIKYRQRIFKSKDKIARLR